MNSTKRYPIKIVSQKSGLSVHTIRAWEKRYNIVQPDRTETNRRLYSENDILRLSLLRKATQDGHSISNVADLSIDDLMKILGEKDPQTNSPSTIVAGYTENYLIQCLNNVQNFDAVALENTLMQASLDLTQPTLINTVIIPLMEQIGELWRNGSIRIMHEHLATAVIIPFLSNLRNTYRPNRNAQRIIVSTPLGQVHEIGALLVALVAASAGWQVVYLGSSLPAEEIAAAAINKNARVVVLSLVYPSSDPLIIHELEKLRNNLPSDTRVIVGGRVSNNYRESIAKIGLILVNDFTDFHSTLENIENNI